MQPNVPHCTHPTRQGGVPMVGVLITAGVPARTAYALECPDVHEMALVIARANAWAKGERTLIAELPDSPLPTPSWASVHRAGLTVAFAWLAFLTCLLIVVQLAS